MLLETAEPDSPLVDASASNVGSDVPCNKKHKPSAAGATANTACCWINSVAPPDMQTSCKHANARIVIAAERKSYDLHCSSKRAVNVQSGSKGYSFRLPDISARNASMPLSRQMTSQLCQMASCQVTSVGIHLLHSMQSKGQAEQETTA